MAFPTEERFQAHLDGPTDLFNTLFETAGFEPFVAVNHDDELPVANYYFIRGETST